MPMPYEERRAVYEAAIEHYGQERQTLKAVEEMAELTKELAKSFIPNGTTLDKIVDEIADVTVMMEQLRIIFSVNDAVQERVAYKVKRLQHRVETEPETEG